ncbi:hypothetical protein KQX54_006744 [Cotesia glomerata]|uniref:Uncharacterized protein n=1 Tax=Cotesia glomerata TaxID=32391 RepID=A0AAV7J5U6_COTGL|nr:hypothetical protein KQX54_006744 [Cotesia glomerata]
MDISVLFPAAHTDAYYTVVLLYALPLLAYAGNKRDREIGSIARYHKPVRVHKVSGEIRIKILFEDKGNKNELIWNQYYWSIVEPIAAENASELGVGSLSPFGSESALLNIAR